MSDAPFGWGDVTILEFAALDLISDPNALARVNRYWDELHVDPANMWPGEKPNRLTPAGVAWLADLHERYTVTTPARDAALMAREIINGLGTLHVLNSQRIPA